MTNAGTAQGNFRCIRDRDGASKICGRVLEIQILPQSLPDRTHKALPRGGSVNRKVVLFYPPYDGPPLSAPLCLLALASPLLHAGFDVRLVDNLTSPDFENVILREIHDALCLGISVLTGPTIGAAIKMAQKVK